MPSCRAAQCCTSVGDGSCSRKPVPTRAAKQPRIGCSCSCLLLCACIPGLAQDRNGEIAGARVYGMLWTARGLRAKTGRNAGTRCKRFAGRVWYAEGGGPAALAWSAKPRTAAAARAKNAGAWCAAGGRWVRPGAQNLAQLLDGERRAEQMQWAIHADPHTEGTHQETPGPPCCGRTRQRRRRRRRPRRQRPHTAPGAPFGAGLSRERLTSKNRTF